MVMFVAAALLLAIGLLSPLIMRRAGLSKLKLIAVSVLCIALAVVVGIMSCITVVNPGRIARAYSITGQQRTLSQGYNLVAPWDRIYDWDATVSNFEFFQGDAAYGVQTAGNDVFGAQSKDADYIYAQAKISVRIDPARMGDYIDLFGTDNSTTALRGILKDTLKAALDLAFKDYGTEELMTKKAEVADKAVVQAKEFLTTIPIIVEHLSFPDFDAGSAYEENIRMKAEIRMKTEQAELRERQNSQEAAANKIKAEGEAAVKLVEATNEASMKKVAEENTAAIKLIQANADAEVKETQAAADAKVVTISAEAEATAMLTKSEAESKGLELVGAVYQKYPSLITRQELTVQQDAASRWNGMLPQFSGAGSFNFADMTDMFSTLFTKGLAEALPPTGGGE